MFRRWLSNFIRNNKEKLRLIVRVIIGVALFIFAIRFVFSNLKISETTPKNTDVYNPSETVISGANIREEEFKEENNLVKDFVDLCNNGSVKEAYNLLTDECKEKLYPTLTAFKNNYYNIIFNGSSKEYNLQSWVSSGKYNTYRVRFTEDFMSTGNYDDTVKYEDYITIVTDNDDKKLNINGYVKTENLNRTSQTEIIEANVLSKDIYMEYVIYYINIKNLSDRDILLDNLEGNTTLKLIGSNGAEYKLDSTNLKSIDLDINSHKSENIKLKFIKQYGSNVGEKYITFKKVILDYGEYRVNKKDYNNYKEINIKL